MQRNRIAIHPTTEVLIWNYIRMPKADWIRRYYMLKHLMLVVFIGITCTPVSSWAKDPIRWMIIDYPPIYFSSGDNIGQGIADQALRLLMARMGEYEHGVEVGTVSRITEAMKHGENVCTPTLFVTEERKQFGIFAHHPTTFLPPLAIIVRTEEAELFRSQPEPLSLSALMAGSRFTLGVVANHSYGREVDQVIDAYRGRDHLVIRSGIGATEGLLEMVLKHRIDFTIAYPWSLAAKLGTDAIARFNSAPFAEAGAYARHYTLCTGNDWGREVVRRIDQVLEAELPTPGYRVFIERWLPPDVRPSFHRSYDEFLAGGMR